MTLKDKILIDLTGIKSPRLLNQIFEFIQIIKDNYSILQESNKREVLKFAREISDDDAKEITSIINNEFNSLEREW